MRQRAKKVVAGSQQKKEVDLKTSQILYFQHKNRVMIPFFEC